MWVGMPIGITFKNLSQGGVEKAGQDYEIFFMKMFDIEVKKMKLAFQ